MATPRARRKVWFGAWVETPVYWRDHLPLDPGLTGPCIIEQMDTTIVIDRVGEATLAIADSSIVSVELASATLDRAVEKDGLVCLRWVSTATAFDTYLRVMKIGRAHV